MTLEEFSNGFDTLVSSYRRFKDFDNKEILDSVEFDEYEKSFYLTKAQDEIVLALYNGRNSLQESFEETEELRRYLENLVLGSSLNATTAPAPGVSEDSKFFALPSDLWFIVYEELVYSTADCGQKTMEVVPVRHDEFHKLRKNPFRGPNSRKALRLDLSDNVAELVCQSWPSGYNYNIRYVRKLKPIVVETLPNELTVKGVNTATPCEVHESLHGRILERAVQMALEKKLGARKADS